MIEAISNVGTVKVSEPSNSGSKEVAKVFEPEAIEEPKEAEGLGEGETLGDLTVEMELIIVNLNVQSEHFLLQFWASE